MTSTFDQLLKIIESKRNIAEDQVTMTELSFEQYRKQQGAIVAYLTMEQEIRDMKKAFYAGDQD